MTKRLSLFFIIGLLGAQMFSLLHTAEHAFEKHEHQGQVCDIYQYSEQSQDITPATFSGFQIPVYVTAAPALFERVVTPAFIYSPALARAPPYFS